MATHTDIWKEKLLRSFKKLVATDIHRVLDECYSRGIFTDDERDKVAICQTTRTPNDTNRQFLMILLRKSEAAYKIFLECLETDNTDHSNAMSIIMETDVSQPLSYEEHPEAMQLRRKIYRNLQTVVENTDLKDIVDDFIAWRIFGIEDLEKVRNFNLTTDGQNKKFLNLLLKKRSHGYRLLISELRQRHAELVETIEQTDITDSEEEIDKEIEAHLCIVDLEERGVVLTSADLERIQRNLHPEDLEIIRRNLHREISPGKLKSWTQDGETFYPTEATKLIYDEVKSKRYCISVGLPGAGKTANIHYVALRLKNEGHRLCCVQTFKELISKIDRFGDNKQQVYVIDDVFGVHGVDETKRKEWCDDNKDDLERCLNNKNVSILCSSRKQVIDDHKLSNIKSRFTIVNISEGKAVLSGDERAGIFEKHAITKQRSNLLTENKDQLKPEIKEKVGEIECPVGCFPLVCHLYTGEEDPKQTIEEYFNKPLNIIADHLKKLEVEDSLSHLCLLLCLIYDNKLPVNIITVGDESEETNKLRMKLLELCELPGTTSRQTIQKKMATLLQTFVKREGDTYRFVHDIIHDAVIKHVSNLSSSVHQVIMSHCSAKFMRDRVHLSGVVCKDYWGDPGHDTESCINIRHDSFTCWGVRVLDIVLDGVRTSDQLYNDIHEGRCSIHDRRVWWDNNPWRDVFYNPCVHSTEGQTAIVQVLDRKSQSDVQTLMCTDGYSLWGGTHRHTALHWSIYQGLTHIVRQTLSMISTTRLRQLDSTDRYGKGLLSWAEGLWSNTDIEQIVRQKLQEGQEDSDEKQTVRKEAKKGQNVTKSKCIMM